MGGPWNPVNREREPIENPALFRATVSLTFQNYSSEVARIVIVNPDRGEVTGGNERYVLPREALAISWSRVTSSNVLQTDEQIHDVSFMSLKFWVTDLGMNVRDEFLFNADLRYFRRDGSRLIVSPEPAIAWAENIAMPTSSRTYDRLDL